MIETDRTLKLVKRKRVVNILERIAKYIGKNLVAIISLCVTVWIGLIANKLAITENELDEHNQAINISGIDLIGDNEDYFLVRPDITQGKIKKAYLVLIKDDDIIYTHLDPSLEDFRIDKELIDLHAIKVLDMEAGVTDFQDFADNHNAQINDVVDFGLVFLDYSNQWSFYYVLIRPGFVFYNVSYKSTVTSLDGSEVTYDYVGNYIASPKTLVIDTALINKSTLEEQLEEFDVDIVPVYFDKISRELRNDENADIVFDEETATFFIPYTFKNASELMDIFNSVKKDLY